MKFALLLWVAFAIAAFGQGAVFFVPPGTDPNGSITATRPAAAYDEFGNYWLKLNAYTDNQGWVLQMGGAPNPSTNPPSGDLDMASNNIVRVRDIQFINGSVFDGGRMTIIVSYQTNVVVFLTNYVTVSNVVYQPEFDSLRFQSRVQISQRMSGRTDTNVNWKWLTDGVVNTNCWTYGWDFSGMSVQQDQGGIVTLITRRHGIAANHSSPSPGTQLIFLGTDGLRYTNWAEANSTFSNDLQVVTFSNDFPSAIRPFPVLPTNFPSYFQDGDWGMTNPATRYPLEMVWYRPNRGTMNVIAAHSLVAGQQGAYRIPNSPLPEFLWPAPTVFLDAEGGTSGDSGSPVFIIANGEPHMYYATHFGAPSGPTVNWPFNFEFIQSVCGTNYPLRTANLSRYSYYP